MAILFRTDDALKWGMGKGSNLTPTEVDLNFWELVSRVTSIEENPPEPNEISNILVEGHLFTIYLEDGTQFGPYELPVATFAWRGEWTPDTAYFAFDVVTVLNVGLFMVTKDHISAATFDPNAVDASLEALYQQMFGVAVSPPLLNALYHGAFGGI